MSSTTVPRPTNPSRPSDPSESLETRIVQAERAVIERDMRLRRRLHELGDRLSHNAGRKIGIGVAAVAGLALVGGWLRGQWRRSHPKSQHVRPPRSTGSAGRFAGTLALLLPLLPTRWQARMSPGGSAALVGLALPLINRLLRGGVPANPPATAALVDLDRYAGHWYEIARLPSSAQSPCASDSSAHYQVVNGRVEVTNRCRDADGREVVVHGEARVLDMQTQARLEVSFAPPLLRQLLPLVWTDYWILDVDAGYRHALVGTPDRSQLWVLARSPSMARDELDRLLDHAQAEGYDTSHVQLTVHGGVAAGERPAWTQPAPAARADAPLH